MMIGPGCVCCGCHNEMLNLNHLCVACQVAIERDLRRERAEQIHALRVFGEAIAAVARAQMVERAAAGHTITVELGARTIELWQHGGSLCVSEYSALAPRRLREIRGWREDVAIHAVAALIEECERFRS